MVFGLKLEAFFRIESSVHDNYYIKDKTSDRLEFINFTGKFYGRK